MKLELKHLAGYLPYGLKCLYTHTKEVGQISNIYTIGEGYDNEDIKLSINFLEGGHIWMYKPILRPLSDLTKEIEVNGELHQMWLLAPNCEHYDGTQLINRNGYKFEIEELKYSTIQTMLRFHFDIFGLIENGLAVDINTLDKDS